MWHDRHPIRGFAVCRDFPLLKGYCLKPKICPKNEKKSFPDVLVTVNQYAIYTGKNVQLFHETFIQGVNQFLGDPNCEAS